MKLCSEQELNSATGLRSLVVSFIISINIDSWRGGSRSETRLYIEVQFRCEAKFYKGTLYMGSRLIS